MKVGRKQLQSSSMINILAAKRQMSQNICKGSFILEIDHFAQLSTIIVRSPAILVKRLLNIHVSQCHIGRKWRARKSAGTCVERVW